MKKLIFTALLALVCAGGYAQITSSSSLVITKKALDPVKRGYQSDVRLGTCYTFDSYDSYGKTSIEATYTGGYRFGNTLYLGAGVGLNYNTRSGNFIQDEGCFDNWFNISPAKLTVPLFAQARVYFSKNRISPFVDATAGAMIAGKSEITYGAGRSMAARYGRTLGFGTLSVGVNCRMTDKTSMYLLVGGKLYGVRVLQADEPFYPFDLTPENLPASLNIGTRTDGGLYVALGFTF